MVWSGRSFRSQMHRAQSVFQFRNLIQNRSSKAFWSSATPSQQIRKKWALTFWKWPKVQKFQTFCSDQQLTKPRSKLNVVHPNLPDFYGHNQGRITPWENFCLALVWLRTNEITSCSLEVSTLSRRYCLTRTLLPTLTRQASLVTSRQVTVPLQQLRLLSQASKLQSFLIPTQRGR